MNIARKKNKLITLIPFLIIVSLYICLPILQKKDIESVVSKSEIKTHEFFKSVVQQYDIIRCELGLNNIKNAFVYEDKIINTVGHHIHFYASNRESLFSRDFYSNYTGSTTIRNATYPELLKMIKKDCSRFQRSGSVSLNPDEMTWVYSPAPTKEEIERDKVEKIEGIKSEISELSSEKRQELADEYNYNPEFTDDELYEWAEEVDLSDFDPEG